MNQNPNKTNKTNKKLQIFTENWTALGELKEGEELPSILLQMFNDGVEFHLEHPEGYNPRLRVMLDIEETHDYFRQWNNFESFGY